MAEKIRKLAMTGVLAATFTSGVLVSGAYEIFKPTKTSYGQKIFNPSWTPFFKSSDGIGACNVQRDYFLSPETPGVIYRYFKAREPHTRAEFDYRDQAENPDTGKDPWLYGIVAQDAWLFINESLSNRTLDEQLLKIYQAHKEILLKRYPRLKDYNQVPKCGLD